MGVKLETDFLGLKLNNPTVLASGIMGVNVAALSRAEKGGAGAVTIKSITKNPRKGHPNPIVADVGDGLLNAVGYSNMGVEAAVEEYADVGKRVSVPVIANVVGTDAKDFAYLAKKMSGLGFSAVEVVLSCPHTPGYGLLAGHSTPEATHEITSKVRDAVKLPLIVKLSPNTQELGKVAKAAQDAGADAINMGNTLGPGLRIDPVLKRPVLGYGPGGLSGPALKPVAVRCVWDVYESVSIPIIGTGGVTPGLDAVEMLMAGASAVGVGTAVYLRGVDCFKLISKELTSFMKENGYSKVKELTGAAHGGKK
ncbi:Dihydroorotate dehydrogenase [uncultured archaeon]|nr:Dihydroorotate dehydrogenase [uncultured archaeon]